MNTASIVFKAAGQVIPEAFVTKVLSENPSCSGFIVQSKLGENTPTTLDGQNDRGQFSVEEFMQMQGEIKEDTALFFFGKMSDPEFDNDDIQPFILQEQDQDGVTISVCAIFMEGDFAGYSDPKSGHSDEYNAFHEVLLPILQQKWTKANGAYGKFHELLSEDKFKNTCISMTAHRGAFVFLPKEGELVVHSNKNEIGGNYDWGFASVSYGYSEEMAESQEPVSRFGKFKRGVQQALKPKAATEVIPKEAPETIIPPKPEEKPKEIPAIVNNPKPEAPKTATADVSGVEYVTVPDSLAGKGRKKYIRGLTGGTLPDGWHEKGFKVARKAAVVKDLKDLPKAIADAKAKLPEAAKTSSVPAAGTKQVNITDKNVSKIEANVLPANIKTEIQTAILAYLDPSSNKIPNPTELQKSEEGLPTVSEQMGFAVEDLLVMHADFLRPLFKKYPQFTELAFFEMRKFGQGHVDMKDLVAKRTKTEEKKTEAVAPKPAEAPKVAAAGGAKKKWF